VRAGEGYSARPEEDFRVSEFHVVVSWRRMKQIDVAYVAAFGE